MLDQPIIVTDLTEEPVTLAEVKAFCKIDADYAGDDDILELLLSASRELLEQKLGVYFGIREITIEFMADWIDLPYGPFQSVTSLNQIFDADPDVEITDLDYVLDGSSFKRLIINGPWNYRNWEYPVEQVNAVTGYPDSGKYRLTYFTGYEELPKALKFALLTQVDYMYKNQGLAGMQPISKTALQLASPFNRNLSLAI